MTPTPSDESRFTRTSLVSLMVFTAIPWLIFIALIQGWILPVPPGGLEGPLVLVFILVAPFALILAPFAIKICLEVRSFPARAGLIFVSCSFLLCTVVLIATFIFKR